MTGNRVMPADDFVGENVYPDKVDSADDVPLAKMLAALLKLLCEGLMSAFGLDARHQTVRHG